MSKNRVISTLLIMITLSSVLAMFLHDAKAVGANITSISPTEQVGYVGDRVYVTGTINTTNGLCQLWFDSRIVNETRATGNNVSATFLVPQLPGGDYTLMLRDVNATVNATTSFHVNMAHYIQAKAPAQPRQLQEGDSVGVCVNVTGAEANKTYAANVTVMLPTPVNTTFWTLLKFNTTSTGEGHNLTAVYPSSFQGLAHMNLTGVYTAAFNSTLAATAFTVGLANATEYHRFQYVDVRAAAYKPGENVTVKVSFGAKAVQKQNVTTDSGGLIRANWTVPFNATIGTYTLNVTSISASPTTKNPPDVQAFRVPGFDINVTVRNLAEEPVAGLSVRVFEAGKSFVNSSSDFRGFVPLRLEIGGFLINASFRGKKVGERTIDVVSAAAIDLKCNLTNLRIMIMNQAGIRIPEVNIFLKPDNRTLAQSDINGTIVEHSLLPIVARPYVLNASRYDDRSFNVTTIPTLLVNGSAVAWYDVTIVCPTFKLQVNVTRADSQPISNAKVKVKESMGGIFNEEDTTVEGIAILNCTFGKYKVEVYDARGIKLCETAIDLFQNKNISISCRLYGLTISVKVVDYFGQSISNANITIQLGDIISRSNLTQSDGTATFYGIDGGIYKIAVRLAGQTETSIQKSFGVDASTQTIPIRIDRYVLLAGFLVETSQLAIVLVVAVTVITALAIEVHKRRGHVKAEETEK